MAAFGHKRWVPRSFPTSIWSGQMSSAKAAGGVIHGHFRTSSSLTSGASATANRLSLSLTMLTRRPSPPGTTCRRCSVGCWKAVTGEVWSHLGAVLQHMLQVSRERAGNLDMRYRWAMPESKCIGTCSLCGGRVIKHVGVWMSIAPPPPPACEGCGAHPSGSVPPVIQMVPMAPHDGSVGVVWPPDLPRCMGMPMSDGKWRA